MQSILASQNLKLTSDKHYLFITELDNFTLTCEECKKLWPFQNSKNIRIVFQDLKFC